MDDPRMEARRRLENEERVRRMMEGGESMRAQLAVEDAQRRRAGRESMNFTGLTPEEEERRRLLSHQGVPHAGLGESQRVLMDSWGRDQESSASQRMERQTMEDRIAREIEAERRPADVSGLTPAEQMARRDRELGRSDMPSTYSRREGPVEERPTIGEETARLARGLESREHRSTEDPAQRDLGKAGGGTYYYGDREDIPRGEASPTRHFSRTEGEAHDRPSMESQPLSRERMRERGQDVTSAMSRTSEQTLDRTKEYGRRLSERTREVTGGASAEELASQAGESIGRGIKKVVSVGSGIISGLRRGVGDVSRERRHRHEEDMERSPEREREGESEYGHESQPRQEYRETEYREVSGRSGPKR